jgi:hypothetical protein
LPQNATIFNKYLVFGAKISFHI